MVIEEKVWSSKKNKNKPSRWRTGRRSKIAEESIEQKNVQRGCRWWEAVDGGQMATSVNGSGDGEWRCSAKLCVDMAVNDGRNGGN